MKRKQGRAAATLFVVMSLGGMIALFSQVRHGDGDDRAVHLDVSSPGERVFREVLPAAVESGVAGDAASTERATAKREEEPPVRLFLR